MFMLGPIGFTAPWLLLGLAALPILWLLLRAVPPAPIRRRFPGVALLLGLSDDEVQTDKTPWWLLLLRMLAVAGVIIGFAGPVLNPQTERGGEGPLLILSDGSWAAAPGWPRRQDHIEALLEEAARAGRPVALASLTDLPEAPQFQAADVWAARVAGLTPAPWQPDADAMSIWVEALGDARFETYWLSDGLARDGRDALLAALQGHGPVTVYQSPRVIHGLRPARFADGTIQITALRDQSGGVESQAIIAHGLDPAGVDRELARGTVEFEAGSTEATLSLVLPPELRNRITRFQIAGQRSAGAVSLTDDGLKRREVALIAGRDDREGLELLSPLHYLEQALVPTADLIDGTLTDVLLANPDAIVLADVASLTGSEASGLIEWVEQGGLLVRFAGPRLAASEVSRAEEDPLMPVRLRVGGRTVGGAMSWGEPKGLAPFPATSPFNGLPISDEVQVTAQVMAQPDPTLADRVIASLADGTPLVTRKRAGEGQIVLFHVTANAEWSSLPLSGLFVQMLERLAVSTRPARPEAAELAGTTWVAEELLDGFGQVRTAGKSAGIPGERLATGQPGADMPPGLYAGSDRRIAVNALDDSAMLSPADWPADVPVEGLGIARETLLKGAFLAAALALFMADILASLWVSGRLFGPRPGVAAALLGVALLALPQDGLAQAAEDDFALTATTEVVLAHVLTGDGQVDRVAHAGLTGLSDILFQRTSIEPADPIAVDLERDELSFFPLLYWPVTTAQPMPSAEAYAKLNRYLRGGGMILFDTRDADLSGLGAATPEGRKLQALAAALDIPPLEPVPEDHVLTRAFYLIQDFPGRHVGRDVWVEAAPPDAQKAEGMPFRNLNDGVTPVVIGGNDWAAAWAVDDSGQPMFRVGRGLTGERQREIAYRFGVNLMMHVLTGNYKSDQVHVPALLERLGQ